MKQEQLFNVQAVAFGVIALLAAAMVWVGFSGPSTDQGRGTEGIIWFIVASVMVIGAIRKKPFHQTGLDRKSRVSWMSLTLSVFLFLLVLSAIVLVETWSLARILKCFIYLVLAVFLLVEVIVLQRDARSIPVHK